jgi:hypothetical protein
VMLGLCSRRNSGFGDRGTAVSTHKTQFVWVTVFGKRNDTVSTTPHQRIPPLTTVAGCADIVACAERRFADLPSVDSLTVVPGGV